MPPFDAVASRQTEGPTVLMSRAYPFGGVFVMKDPATHSPFANAGTVATRRGSFHWESALEVTADVWCSTDEFDLLEARVAHDSDAETVVHRRRIMRVDSRFWLITDDVGPTPVAFELQLQCEPSVAPTRVSDATLRLRRSLAHDVLVHATGPRITPWTLSEAWVSPGYGTRRPAMAVGCAVGEGGGRSAMLICEEGDASQDLVSLSAQGGECVAVRGGDPAFVLVKAPHQERVECEVGSTDADIAWIWPGRHRAPGRFLAVRGTQIESDSGVFAQLEGDCDWVHGTFGDPDSRRVGSLNRPEWNQ